MLQRCRRPESTDPAIGLPGEVFRGRPTFWLNPKDLALYITSGDKRYEVPGVPPEVAELANGEDGMAVCAIGSNGGVVSFWVYRNERQWH